MIGILCLHPSIFVLCTTRLLCIVDLCEHRKSTYRVCVYKPYAVCVLCTFFALLCVHLHILCFMSMFHIFGIYDLHNKHEMNRTYQFVQVLSQADRLRQRT